MRTRLHDAADRGSLQKVTELLAEPGIDVNAVDSDTGQTPLHCAAWRGHETVVIALLKAGANKEARCSETWTPLHYAAGGGHEAVVDCLLKAEANKEAQGPEKKTPLHCATRKGHAAVVDVFLKAGANQDARTSGEETPFHLAAELGHAAVVDVFLKAGANREVQNPSKMTPLHCAARRGHAAVVYCLLEAGANKEAQDFFEQTPIYGAAAMGYADVVALLLEAGANKEAQNRIKMTPLHDAACLGHEAVVIVLLRSGANTAMCDGFGNVPLYYAARERHENIAALLLRFGAGIGVHFNPEFEMQWLLAVAEKLTLPLIGATFPEGTQIPEGVITTAKSFCVRHNEKPYTQEELICFHLAMTRCLANASKEGDEGAVVQSAELKLFRRVLMPRVSLQNLAAAAVVNNPQETGYLGQQKVTPVARALIERYRAVLATSFAAADSVTSAPGASPHP